MASQRRDGWRFPVAAMGLRIAEDDGWHTRWEGAMRPVRAEVVFCYRRDPDQGPPCPAHSTMSWGPVGDRRLAGQWTLVVVGNPVRRTIPNGFFRWWRRHKHRGFGLVL